LYRRRLGDMGFIDDKLPRGAELTERELDGSRAGMEWVCSEEWKLEKEKEGPG
jgi:hypothetical protein